MLSLKLTLWMLALLPFAAAQTIDPNTVSLAIREQWCIQQTSSCPLICLQNKGSSAGTLYNNCTASDLSYSCVCSNGLSPNISEYSLTIPYFECTTFNSQCAQNCAQGDSACASACVVDHPCGAQNPTRVKLHTSTTAKPKGAHTATGTAGGAHATLPPSFNGDSSQPGAAPVGVVVSWIALVALGGVAALATTL